MVHMTTTMRKALAGEISRLTTQLWVYSKEVEELQEKKGSLEAENVKMHKDLVLSRRNAERAKLEGTMFNGDAAMRLQDTETQLMSKLDKLQHKFEIERNIVDQQKAHIDNLEFKLEGHQEDSNAAAQSYKAVISKLKSRFKTLQSKTPQGFSNLQVEQDKLQDKLEELQQLGGELKEICIDMKAMREEYLSRQKKYWRYKLFL